ncbi:MAG TPA: hypothetical protein VEI97_14555 [bacterium]|nr:hypothetical protein [bacterium]
MRDPAWIEPFAGSAAVALHLLGGSPPIGYAGNKRAAAPAIAARLWGDRGDPGRIVLADVGPWGVVWRVAAGGGCPGFSAAWRAGPP